MLENCGNLGGEERYTAIAASDFWEREELLEGS
jgi:hypothetical protein